MYGKYHGHNRKHGAIPDCYKSRHAGWVNALDVMSVHDRVHDPDPLLDRAYSARPEFHAGSLPSRG